MSINLGPLWLEMGEIPRLEDCELMHKVALEMFEADNAAGCGFYNDARWRRAYASLQKIVGCRLETSVLGELGLFEGLPDAD